MQAGPPIMGEFTKWKNVDFMLNRADLWVSQVKGGFTVKGYSNPKLKEELKPFITENNLDQILPDEIQVYENLLKAIKKQIDAQK